VKPGGHAAAALYNRIIIATERERSFFSLTSSLHLKSRCASNWEEKNPREWNSLFHPYPDKIR
jgi:hypothetical protein